ncbi:MAG: hypothetical protein ACHQU0_00155 [Candidatus Paceibacteria bacterium]
MFIFNWLASLLDKAKKLFDPWELADAKGMYIGRFRKEFETVADRLSKTMGTVRVRLHGESAEFYTAEGKIVASAVVRGEGGIPCRAIITFDSSFPECLKMTFESVLPGCDVFMNPRYLNQW